MTGARLVERPHGLPDFVLFAYNNVWLLRSLSDNAATMQKLAAEKSAQSPQSMTAVDGLNTYQKIRPGPCL